MSYNLFNKIFFLFKCKLKFADTSIKEFSSKGFVKSKTVDSRYITDLCLLLNDTNRVYKENVTTYIINYNLKQKIKEIFNKYFYNEIKNFEKFFSSKIIVTNVMIWKNHGYDKFNNKDNQFFSEKYHTDNYLFTYFKLFINLEEVNDDKGPLHLIKKKDSKIFLNFSKYKNRNSYMEDKIEKLVYRNTGKAGESLFFSSSECYHRAGIPNSDNSRLMLGFVFNVIPNTENDNYFLLEKSKSNLFINDYWSKYYGKPSKFRDMLKLLFYFLTKKNKKINI